MKYFKDCTTVEAVKKAFRKLAMTHHPDRGGSVETMKEINSQYQAALKSLDGQQDGKFTYHYNQEKESNIADKIQEVLGLHLPNVEVMLIGTWIWVNGDTKPHKESLKNIKFKWHAKRQCWFYSEDKKTRYNNKTSLEGLASKYGFKSFAQDEQTAIKH